MFQLLINSRAIEWQCRAAETSFQEQNLAFLNPLLVLEPWRSCPALASWGGGQTSKNRRQGKATPFLGALHSRKKWAPAFWPLRLVLAWRRRDPTDGREWFS
jgi:hypothetical protein